MIISIVKDTQPAGDFIVSDIASEQAPSLLRSQRNHRKRSGT